MELLDQIAIVTGSGRGIGRAIALELGRAGAKVVVNYRSDAASAEAVVAELGDRGRAVRADVSTTEGAAAVLAAAQAWGGLDILVNNAGIHDDRLAMRMTDEQWQRVMDVNAGSCFRMCRGALELMFRQRRGTIVNLTSIAGIRGNSGQANYAASKAAIIGLTKTLAREMGRRNITVNAVAPGFVPTDMTADVDPRVLEGAKEMVPMGRLGTCEDIAPIVRFLAGPGARYLTGQVIAVDGGMSA
ncbi:MAG: 3-oxoacyl-ACP reductase FabG [Alphaproteobacteria bacterium]|nr:3-oxoacyl-ACP reductase FabG [Alphaproteobacteria bacterium]MCB9695597.1 3-oxoacyl-ACP reductase FabG [Alphaproteobacteria bacterium]